MPLLQEITNIEEHYNQLIIEKDFDTEYLNLAMEKGFLPKTNKQMFEMYDECSKEILIELLKYNNIFLENTLSKEEIMMTLKNHKEYKKYFKEVI